MNFFPKKRKPIWKYVPAALVAVSLLLNLGAREVPGFADWYVQRIFPVFVESYGRFTGAVPFSVGEWMLYLGAFLTLVLVMGGIAFLLFRKGAPGFRRAYLRFAKGYYWIFGIVCLVMTLNCFLLYQVTPMGELSGPFHIMKKEQRTYEFEELAALRDYVVERANALSEEFERDEKGYLCYDGEAAAQAVEEMKRLGQEVPQLSGFYPRPKGLFHSAFFSQQYIMGYYFPFSMEANYNRQMYVANVPATLCHELSHLKGVILEDEANFLGYLACVSSEDAFFQYSGYLSVMGYLDRDFKRACGQDEALYSSHVTIGELAASDKRFLTPEAWQQVEESSFLETNTVRKATDQFLNTTLTLNGVEDGTVSYSRVVALLLQYYDGILYG